MPAAFSEHQATSTQVHAVGSLVHCGNSSQLLLPPLPSRRDVLAFCKAVLAEMRKMCYTISHPVDHARHFDHQSMCHNGAAAQ
eukprot:820085-Pelagomonas_calceolata.AAC.4